MSDHRINSRPLGVGIIFVGAILALFTFVSIPAGKTLEDEAIIMAKNYLNLLEKASTNGALDPEKCDVEEMEKMKSELMAEYGRVLGEVYPYHDSQKNETVFAFSGKNRVRENGNADDITLGKNMDSYRKYYSKTLRGRVFLVGLSVLSLCLVISGAVILFLKGNGVR